MRLALEKKVLFYLLLFFLIILQPVYSTFISISTEIGDVQMEDGVGRSEVIIKNNGDETAYDVSLSLDLPQEFKAEDTFIGQIRQGGEFHETIEIDSPSESSSGTHPGVLVVKYKDANSYPFSALTPFRIIKGNRRASDVLGVFDELTLVGGDSKKLTLSIKNPDRRAHELIVTLHLPNELNAREPEKRVSLTGLGEEEVEFEVSSFSALPGSSYAVFASITYVENGAVLTTFSRGVIKVDEKKSFFSNKALWTALIILLLVFLAYQLRRGGE